MNYKKGLGSNCFRKVNAVKTIQLITDSKFAHKRHLRDTLFLIFYRFYLKSLSPRIKCSLPKSALMIGFLLPQAWLMCLMYVSERWTLNNHSSVFLVISYRFICTIYIIFSVLLSVRGHACYCGFQLKILYYKGFNFEPHFSTLYTIFLICGSNKWRNIQCNPIVLIASNLYSDTVREHVMCLCCVCVLSYMMLYESINLFYARTVHATRNWSLCLTLMLFFE